jgi:hypothetical protein
VASYTILPVIVFIGGLLGGLGGFFAAFDGGHRLSLNVGGKPYNSWPAFIPITLNAPFCWRHLRRSLACWL